MNRTNYDNNINNYKFSLIMFARMFLKEHGLANWSKLYDVRVVFVGDPWTADPTTHAERMIITYDKAEHLQALVDVVEGCKVGELQTTALVTVLTFDEFYRPIVVHSCKCARELHKIASPPDAGVWIRKRNGGAWHYVNT